MLKKLFRISILVMIALGIYFFPKLYSQTARVILNPVPTLAPEMQNVEITHRHANGTRDRYLVPPSQVFEFNKMGTGTEASLIVGTRQLQIHTGEVVCITTIAVPQIFREVGDVEGNQTCLTVADAQ